MTPKQNQTKDQNLQRYLRVSSFLLGFSLLAVTMGLVVFNFRVLNLINSGVVVATLILGTVLILIGIAPEQVEAKIKTP